MCDPIRMIQCITNLHFYWEVILVLELSIEPCLESSPYIYSRKFWDDPSFRSRSVVFMVLRETVIDLWVEVLLNISASEKNLDFLPPSVSIPFWETALVSLRLTYLSIIMIIITTIKEIAISPLKILLLLLTESSSVAWSTEIEEYPMNTYRARIVKNTVDDPYKSYPGFCIFKLGKTLSKY